MKKSGSLRSSAIRSPATPGNPPTAPGRCPFLGTPADPTTAFAFPSDGNHCFKTGQAISISGVHQETYCLNGRYLTCPVFQREPASTVISPSAASPVSPAVQSPARQRSPVPAWSSQAVELTDFVPDEYPGESDEESNVESRTFPGRYLLLGLIVLALLALSWWAWSSDILSQSGQSASPKPAAANGLAAPSPTATPSPGNDTWRGEGNEAMASVAAEVSNAPAQLLSNTPRSEQAVEPATMAIGESLADEAVASAMEVEEPPCTPPDGWVPYVVESGDAIGALARTHGLAAEELRRANCLSSDEVAAGSLLFVPLFGIIELPAFTDTPSPAPTSASQPATTGSVEIPTLWPALPITPSILPSPMATVTVIIATVQSSPSIPAAPAPTDVPIAAPPMTSPTIPPPPTSTPPAVVLPTSTAPSPP